MRRLLGGLALALGALLPALAQAQSWAAPLALPRQSHSVLSGNSCTQTNQISYVQDFGTEIRSPDAVYSLSNGPSTLRRVGNLLLFVQGYGTAQLRLSPQGWDASLWLCRYNSGGQLSACIDASDNPDFQSEQVNVPHEQGTFRVVVDGGIFTTGNCGNYTLEVTRQTW